MNDQWQRIAHKDGGFTLVELSVAFAIALIITGLAYETYLLTSRMVARWQRSVIVSNAAHRIAHQVAVDVRRAKALVTRPHEKTLTLVLAPHDTVRYQWIKAVVRRNGRPMHPLTVGATGVDVRAEPLGQRFWVDVAVRMTNRPLQGADEATARRTALPADTVALSLRVATRLPAPWPTVSP